MGNWIRDISLKYKFWAVNAVAFLTTLLLVLHALSLEQQGRADDARNAAQAQARLLESWPAGQALPASSQVQVFASGGAPQLEFHTVNGPFHAAGEAVIPVPLQHGGMTVLGFRLGGFAYATDCNEVPPESRALLRNLDLLILDALRFSPHPTHFTLPEALAMIAELQPRRALLTHIAHEIDHAAVAATLPPGVELGYDGLIVEV